MISVLSRFNSLELQLQRDRINARSQFKIFGAVLSCFVALFASPEALSQNLLATKNSVEFIAIGKPAMLKIHGHSEKLEATLSIDQQKLSGEISLPLASLDTGLEIRDEHMKKKYLEVEKAPQAILRFESFELPMDLEKCLLSKEKSRFKGTLELHQVSRVIEGDFLLTKLVRLPSDSTGKSEIDRSEVVANFSLALSDFNIEIPSYMGIKVADRVEIEVKLELERKGK